MATAVCVLLGDGSGGFGAKTEFGTGNGPMSIAVGDFNGDGKADLVDGQFSKQHHQRAARQRRRRLRRQDRFRHR